MRNADHDRNAAADAVDSAADQRLALVEAQISVFLRLDAGGDHHGGAAIVDDVVDLALERGLVDCQVGIERGERRDDEAGGFVRRLL